MHHLFIDRCTDRSRVTAVAFEGRICPGGANLVLGKGIQLERRDSGLHHPLQVAERLGNDLTERRIF